MPTLTCICCHAILPENHMLRLFGDPICRTCSSTVTIGRAIIQLPPFEPPQETQIPQEDTRKEH